MKMEFSTLFWEWYGQGEYKRVLAVCNVIPALRFLSVDADTQRETIPDCPACETWSTMILPLADTLSTVGTAMPSTILAALQDVWDLSNSLSEGAVRCRDRYIFDHEEWQPLRASAKRALLLLDEEKIAPYLDEVTEHSHIELDGWKRKT